MKNQEIKIAQKSEMFDVATELCEIRKREKYLLIRYDQLQIIINTVEQITADDKKDEND